MRGTARAYAKLNISLDVTALRGDGHHEMRSVMQTVSLCDDITLDCGAEHVTGTRSTLKFLPGDARNLATRAALMFFDETGLSGGVKIDIVKRIPVCAGLAGGSADAACVLRALRDMLAPDMAPERLLDIARKIGTDVPFCVRGGTSLATGRGDELLDLEPLPDCFFVIAKPSFSVSTPELFSRIDVSKIRARPDTDGILRAVSERDLPGVAHRMYNVFEDVLPRGRDEIEELKGRLLDFHALGAVMTGTGSAVFGVFDDRANAQNAQRAISRTHGETFLAAPVGRLI